MVDPNRMPRPNLRDRGRENAEWRRALLAVAVIAIAVFLCGMVITNFDKIVSWFQKDESSLDSM
jgi:hypothetical protein